MRTERWAVGALAVVLAGAALLGRPTGTEAAFAVTSGTPGNAMTSAPDWRPPQIGRATAVKAEGGIPGYIRQGGQYRVHAAVTDDPASNPPAGVGTVTAGIGALPAMPMTGTAATVGGLAYSHQTALHTAPALVPEGSYAGWVRATDLATPPNSAPDLAATVVVDNTAPAPVAVDVANGGTVRRADSGDRVTVTWAEVVDPQSMVGGWAGAAMDVTVRITDSTAIGGDVLTVWNAANTLQLPLGSVALGGNYVSASTTFGAAGASTRSRLSWAASPGTQFAVVLGPPNVAGNVANGGTATGTLQWTPDPAVYDRAGNRSTTTVVSETGIADRDF